MHRYISQAARLPRKTISEIFFSEFGARITAAPATFVASASPTQFATASLTKAFFFSPFGYSDLDSYYHNRILRWAGHVERMPISRAPRQLLTGWVAHPRRIGYLRALGKVALGPVITRGRVLVQDFTRAGELTVRRRASSVDHSGLVVKLHRAGHLLSARSLVVKHV
jgi:hypothetical protein